MLFSFILLCRLLLIYLVRFDYSISFFILFFSHFIYFYLIFFYLLAFKFREAVRYLPYGACPVVGVKSGFILEYPSPFGGAITDAPSSKTGQTLLRGNVSRNGKRPSFVFTEEYSFYMRYEEYSSSINTEEHSFYLYVL